MGLRYSVNLDNADVLSPISNSTIAPYLDLTRCTNRFVGNNCKSTTYACQYCLTHLSKSSLVISDQYRGKTGDAYLVHNVVNIINGKKEFRQMTTGMYTVCDIMCHQCRSVVGWKYLRSNEKPMKFKEGKYILEVNTVVSLDD